MEYLGKLGLKQKIYVYCLCPLNYIHSFARRYLWGQESFQFSGGESGRKDRDKTLRLLTGTETHVPLTHISVFTRKVGELVMNRNQNPWFVPVIDTSRGTAVSFFQFVRNIDIFLNGERESFTILPANADGDQLSSVCALWRCSIPMSSLQVDPSLTTCGSLQDDFQSVWAEYLSARSLVPLSVLVTGPPRSGKSELAVQIADRCVIFYFDLS